jgi:hypothetical protein
MSQPILDQRITNLAQTPDLSLIEDGNRPDERDLVVEEISAERGGDQFIEQARVEFSDTAWLDLSARMLARTLRALGQ